MVNKKHFRPGQITTVGRVLLFYILCSLSFIAATAFTNHITTGIKDHLSFVLAVPATLLLIVLFARMGKITLRSTGVIPGKATAARFFCGYLVGLSMAAGQALILISFGQVHLALIPHQAIIRVMLFIILFLLAALREELVFRSYALTDLRVSVGPVCALAIITILFILEHIAAGEPLITAIVGSGMGGLLFGYAALKTRGLALPLGIHSAWNFGQWMLGFKGMPGIWRVLSGDAHNNGTPYIGLAAFALVMALGLFGFHLFYGKNIPDSPAAKDEAA
ncbi:type II CAAX endopeptidase family protein [Mucilaginibacter sp.]|jgi:membrane protease YdiL (CAAX protease family)|uniref:CPBP family intramembrane glutamic endopeptidase n=1 Tax=Mucilaginibacter sp. TaxID=1882438 RepID=UPI002BC01FFC|nr:type II CAAX endopeptidase family protein [Mucilaginibacter sp.]HTI60782.1 type II CAAX endopeptidase family protein [Mucilaginibacter sp.]